MAHRRQEVRSWKSKTIADGGSQSRESHATFISSHAQCGSGPTGIKKDIVTAKRLLRTVAISSAILLVLLSLQTAVFPNDRFGSLFIPTPRNL